MKGCYGDCNHEYLPKESEAKFSFVDDPHIIVREHARSFIPKEIKADALKYGLVLGAEQRLGLV